MSELNFLDTGGNKQKITTPVVNSIAFNTANTERLRITSDGRILFNTTSTTNTDDFLTIKRPAGGHSAISMTVDATTATGSYANAFINTKSKGYYYNGLVFSSSEKHEGGIVGRTTGSGSNDPSIEVRVGGTGINASDTLAMSINHNGYVTKPNQPAFSTNAQTSGFSSNSPNFLTPSARINNGNYYNASNGRFTVPIDGTYFFFFSYAGDNGVAAPVMYFAVNGSDSGPGQSCYYTAYQGAYTGQLYTLSEGDYVNASAKDWNGATPDPWNTYWGGWLLY